MRVFFARGGEKKGSRLQRANGKRGIVSHGLARCSFARFAPRLDVSTAVAARIKMRSSRTRSHAHPGPLVMLEPARVCACVGVCAWVRRPAGPSAHVFPYVTLRGRVRRACSANAVVVNAPPARTRPPGKHRSGLPMIPTIRLRSALRSPPMIRPMIPCKTQLNSTFCLKERFLGGKGF